MDAYERGVKVQVVLDKIRRTHKHSSAILFFNARLPVKIDSVLAIARNKAMVIDREVVIAESFNFTKAAEEANA